MVVFGQKWLYTGKKDCIRVKMGVFGQSGCIRAVWLYSGKSGCIQVKVAVFGQKLLYSGEVVVIGEFFLYAGKVVVFWKK